MMPWLRNNPLLGVLAAIAIVLLVAIGFEGEFGASVGSVVKPGASRRAVPSDAKLLPPLVAMAPEVAYPETVARPPFTPTRRPAPEAAASGANTFQKGQFVLQGVIVVGDNRIAMLREKSSGRIHRVERGKEVNGIKVTEIQRETVTLALGGEEERLSLTVQKTPGAAPAAPQGPFAPPAPDAGIAAPGTPNGLPIATVTPITPIAGSAARPGSVQSGVAASPNPAVRAAPEAGTAMTPEELLARRRARRTQQTQ